jgi:hypothetical protein
MVAFNIDRDFESKIEPSTPALWASNRQIGTTRPGKSAQHPSQIDGAPHTDDGHHADRG